MFFYLKLRGEKCWGNKEMFVLLKVLRTVDSLPSPPSHLAGEAETEQEVEQVEPALEDEIKVVLLCFVSRLDFQQGPGMFQPTSDVPRKDGTHHTGLFLRHFYIRLR